MAPKDWRRRNVQRLAKRAQAAHRILRRRAQELPWTRLAFSLVMREISGDHSGGETPVPIPNTAVKPTSADGTALATGWESRSLPGISLLFSASSQHLGIRD